MTTYYAKNATMNWSDTNAWNTAANGSGTDATHPLASDSVCDLNGKTVTLDVDVTVATIQTSSTSSSLAISGTRVINANVTSSNSPSTGTILVATDDNLTVNGDVTLSGGATSAKLINCTDNSILTVNGTVAITGTSVSARCIYHNSTGNLTIYNPDDTAVSASGNYGGGIYITANCTTSITGNITNTSASNSFAVSINAYGTLTINGDITASGAAASTYGLSCGNGVQPTITINGDVTNSSTSIAISGGAATITLNGDLIATDNVGYYTTLGTLTVNGNIKSSGSGKAISVLSNTEVIWVGDRTLAVGETCYMECFDNTPGRYPFKFATATDALNLTNSGTIIINVTDGEIITTAAGGTAVIANQTGGQAVVLGADVNITNISGGLLSHPGMSGGCNA